MHSKLLVPLLGVLVLLVSLMAGCGGGGGGGGSIAAVPLSSTMRQMQPGDEWDYSVTGTVSDGGDTVPVTGTISVVWGAQTITTPGLATANVVLFNMTLTGNGTNITDWRRYYQTQDAGGTLWEYGGEDSDGVYWVTSPVSGRVVDYPSPMVQGTSWGENTMYSNGDTDNASATIVGTETVSVSAGVFETYKAIGNANFGGYPATTTEWIAPQIGGMVKGIMLATDPDAPGVSLTLYISLTAKNRAIASTQQTSTHQDLWTWAREVLDSSK